MLRTGEQYREGLRDDREVWIDGERVTDIANHPALKPAVDIRARVYDMAHEEPTAEIMSFAYGNDRGATLLKAPREEQDWWDRWKAVDSVMHEIRGVVVRIGDDNIGEMWSLQDGADIIAASDPRYVENAKRHTDLIVSRDIFHVSANTDPKGDRSKPPQEQDPDMMVHVVKETDEGIVLRGAKYETGSAYADQAFLKPTFGPWTDQKLSEYAVGCIIKMNAPGLKHICRSGFAGRNRAEDYPLANRCDEVDTLIVLDDVMVPWEDVLFYQHTDAARHIRATVNRYSAIAFMQRILYMADMMIGVAVWNCRQTGLDKMQAVREKLADLICYREGIFAHIAASFSLGEQSAAGFYMPQQSLMYAGRIHACTNLPHMMHVARELCGGQICLTPNISAFEGGETKSWLDKFYTLNESWQAEDRRKLLAFARDLLNSDYAGHRLSFVQFAQAPHFVHQTAVYNTFDFDGPLDLVREFAGLSDQVLAQ